MSFSYIAVISFTVGTFRILYVDSFPLPLPSVNDYDHEMILSESLQMIDKWY